MVIGVFVSWAVLGCGVFREPMVKRVHPVSQMKIMTGRSIVMTALLRMRTFLGWFKIVPECCLVKG